MRTSSAPRVGDAVGEDVGDYACIGACVTGTAQAQRNTEIHCTASYPRRSMQAVRTSSARGGSRDNVGAGVYIEDAEEDAAEASEGDGVGEYICKLSRYINIWLQMLSKDLSIKP